MFLEIARFWVSATSYNPDKERYEILRVMGPDEYHDQYPDAETPGLDNNAYTNLMVVWDPVPGIGTAGPARGVEPDRSS